MKKLIGIFWLSCMVFALYGCSSPKLSQLNNGDVILAFGDSLTAGVGANEENSYPNVLTKLSGFEVVNSGVSGETTEEGLTRLPQELEEHSPSILILLEGGNDILRNTDYAQIERNLELMIQTAQDFGVQVVLLGVPEKSLFSNAAPFYSELAKKYDLVFDSKLIGGLMRNPSKKSDAVHFNKEGYSLLAQGVYDLLSKNGALN